MWQADLQEEVQAAKRQGTKDIVSKGLVLLVDSNGRVVRRGVGIPPWKKLADEFKGKVKA